LAAQACPILCFDTCIILDVLRDLTRDTVQAYEVQAAVEAVEAMEQGALIGLVAAQVLTEFADNHAAVENEARAKLADFRARLARMDATAAALGAVGAANIDHLNDHVERARRVINRLMKAAILVKPSNTVAARASQRSISARAPARIGQNNIKDCVITETYIEIAGKISHIAPATPILFVSSNIKDYSPDSVKRAELRADFAPLGMTYFPNLSAAMHSFRTWRDRGVI